VPVQTPIARIGESSSAAAPAEPHASASPTAAQAQVSPPRKATPVAARLLAEHGVRAEDIRSTSRRLTKQDVLTFIAERPAPTARPLTSMRRAIAEHMTRSRQTIPHGQCVADLDLTALAAWREAHKAAFERDEHAGLTFTVLFVDALGRSLRGYAGPPVHIGVAVAIDAGLIVPVVRDADRLDLGGLARAIADLAARARASQLRPDEVQGARMTVTNVGSFGNITAGPIIPVGQLGILAPGLVERRPIATSDGGIRPGWRSRFALVFDRRAFDDLAADRFLGSVSAELVRVPVR
jgi:pyruvate/2-oxoglutarate dehydrogenase complex dihydrolipoamide acyltransferase (E2) component